MPVMLTSRVIGNFGVIGNFDDRSRNATITISSPIQFLLTPVLKQWMLIMAGRTLAQKSSGSFFQGRLPSSPLGATPRPPLRQVYPKPPQGSFQSEYELNESNDSEHYQVLRSSKKTTYTVLRSHDNNLDTPVAADSGSNTKSFIILGLIFLLSLVALGVVYVGFPKLDNDEYQYIKVPVDIEDAKNLGRVLYRYKDKYYYQVLLAIFVTYIFLQTFAIPGSIFLSIISGFLYPFVLALPLVCLCSGVGASFCYLLSYMAGRRLVQRYFPERVATWQQHVDRHRENMTYYILFLRITPFLPNWFINIASPVINVPLGTFFIATVLGVAPPSVVMIQAGQTLFKLTSYGDTFTWGYFGVLAFFAVLSLLPVFFKQRLQEKFD